MATGSSNAFCVLTKTNYATWKVQCRMALLGKKLWKIVSGEETEPEEEARKEAFRDRKDKALSIMVGEPTDPKVVWEQLAAQFQRKTWANELSLERRLVRIKQPRDRPLDVHIKELTELLDEISIVVGPVTEQRRVTHLLSSLPDKYDSLVTAIEGEEAPNWAVAVERLRHHETKLKIRAAEQSNAQEEEALTSRLRPRRQLSGPGSGGPGPGFRGPRCYGCGQLGHI